MPRHPCSRRILVREGRAEPATSVRGATHIQVVSRATRDQADPLAPAGRRFGNFVFGRVRSCSGSGRTIDLPPPAARWEVRGIAKQAALKDQRYRAPLSLFAPNSSCARGAPSQRRRSAERPTFRWSAERPAIRPTRSRRLGGASAISFAGRRRRFRFGRSRRTIDRCRAPGAR